MLVSTYNLEHQRREGVATGHHLLRPLAERMAQVPTLRVRRLCNLQANVTSANPTTAAQSRNIEVGSLLHDVSFAKSLRLQFEALINRHSVCRVPDFYWNQPAEH